MVRHPAVGRPLPFRSGLRSPRLASQLGIALGVSFLICFVTGLISHLLQHPPSWWWWPSRPAGLYRFTQGLHVATGLATIPLLGAKLWSVYPRLFSRLSLEKIGIAALVSAALFEIVSGVLNVARWYTPMPFYFPAAHYWVAWLAVGGLLLHLGMKLPIVQEALRGAEPQGARLSRRGFLGAVGAAAGVVTVSTLGQTVAPLAPVSLLAPRRPDEGPQRVPVNRTAVAAGVREAATSSGYRLTVAGPAGQIALSLAELQNLPQVTVELPIACVEGWSAAGRWSGVRLRDLMAMVGADPGRGSAVVESLEAAGRYRSSTVTGPQLDDPLTLIALRLNGEQLHLDHGFPARLIAPNRPGVLQTKWVTRIAAS